MEYHLAINTGFAVNRYAEPEVWTRIVGADLGLKRVQFTADMLNPDLPADVINSHVKRIVAGCQRYGVSISSVFTGAFTRVNHLSHPDPLVRAHWVSWFKRFVDMAVDLGATSLGSHFGILTAQDCQDPVKRNERQQQTIACWHEVAHYAKTQGLQYLTWEPMSIKREYGETLAATAQLQKAVNTDTPLPFYVCLDVDHGDVSSQNPDDTNPYVWLSTFAHQAPLIHLKQSTRDKHGHWPFTAAYNANGKILPGQVVETLSQHNSTAPFSQTDLILELSFREREPTDSTVIPVLQESVAYWKEALSGQSL